MTLQAITVRPYFRRRQPVASLPLMPADPAITRLTPREKEVLRAWLDHKSAKEIALDLGITHHAVEKRLKMARTKLGAGSSREAARMLAAAECAAEGYGRAVTGSPDLSPHTDPRSSWRHRPLVIGGIAMVSLTVLSLALAATYPVARPTEIEIETDLSEVFAHLDRNDSGYLENPESPFVAATFVNPTDSDQRERDAVIGDKDDPAQVAEFYAAADADRDGRVSLDEYRVWTKASWAEMGIEVKTTMKVLPAPES